MTGSGARSGRSHCKIAIFISLRCLWDMVVGHSICSKATLCLCMKQLEILVLAPTIMDWPAEDSLHLITGGRDLMRAPKQLMCIDEGVPALGWALHPEGCLTCAWSDCAKLLAGQISRHSELTESFCLPLMTMQLCSLAMAAFAQLPALKAWSNGHHAA